MSLFPKFEEFAFPENYYIIVYGLKIIMLLFMHSPG